MALLLMPLLGMTLVTGFFDADPSYETDFSSVNQDKFSQTFRFGLNFGYSFFLRWQAVIASINVNFVFNFNLKG
ncbi:MAG: hypothetical protein IPJ20_21130 [Flammeovirgaceae bacterium]|nr:hypothetical protein [Flammeovirgaceae bacterium]